jgi:Nucleotidyltransferase
MHTAMTREQRRLVEMMRSTTADYASLARSRDEFAGGMQWLKVKKWEYLTRYSRDLITGKQKATSIGPRTPETEAIYGRFIKSRSDLDAQIEMLRPTMAEQTRMARALRLGRAPEDVGAVVRAVGLSELIDHITVIGEAAVYAYECEMAALLPREILPDAGLDLLVAGVHPADSIDELVAILRRARVDVRPTHLSDEHAAVKLRTDEGLTIRLFTSSTIEHMIDRYAEENHAGADAVRWTQEQSQIRSIIVDRMGRAAPVSILDPRAWCIIRCMVLDIEEMSVIQRETAAELTTAMAGMVQELWPESFVEDHLAAMPRLPSLEGDGYPPSPRI